MQPFDYVAHQLLKNDYEVAKSVRTFACGHVIPPENILPLALSKGPTGVEFDFTFKSRRCPKQLDELGYLIFNLCVLVPAGVVVFFPSFDYEQFVVEYWISKGAYSRISSKKKIFREPRASGDVDTVLGAFSRCVESQGGALLLCVVGAKMSEGINFSDDMARCVVMVGLPYPDISDPELTQKMNYLDHQASALGGGTHRTAGRDYYENLCMRAVNQSIGRSIRHIGDYSALILADKRYVTNASVISKIPRWISQQARLISSFGEAVLSLKHFFAFQKSKENTLK
jgi:chromosome transmission fidelity protein 1